MTGLVDGGMERWIDGCWMTGWMDGWMNGQMMNEWIDGRL